MPYRTDPPPPARSLVDAYTGNAPTLTRDQVRAVDRIAIEELGIPGVVLMENAGRNATDALLQHVHTHHSLTARHIHAAILCGGGNNGGDGYVIARHLHNRGAAVTLYALKNPDQLTGDAAINHAICERIGLSIRRVDDEAAVAQAAEQWAQMNVMVDALLGTGFRGAVRQPLAAAIEAMNTWRQGGDGRTVLAVDVPSGLDCDGDEATPSNATVSADLTVTFVAVKSAFLTDAARPHLGRLVVADIGAPPALINRMKLT